MQNKKKKIIYVITKSNFGGAQRYVYDLAASLPKEHYDVSVILGGEGLLKKKLEAIGIQTTSLPYFERDVHIWNDIKTCITLVHFFKKERPDIAHLNSSKAGILGAIAGRVAHIPRIVFTAHGWAFNEERSFLQKFFFLVVYCVTILLSHATIAVSQKTKKQIAWMPYIKNKIQIIHNGITIQETHSKETAREFLSSKHKVLKNATKKMWIGTIAELHKTKGLPYAIEAMRTIVASGNKNIVLIIIGQNGDERHALEHMILKNNLSQHVVLYGFLENASHYLKAFDIFLVSSISEALSYAILEAGSAQLPVVATHVGGIPEIIIHEKTGLLVPPRNTRAITDTLLKLAENDALRTRYGKNLFEYVEKHFSFEEMLEKTKMLYSD